MQLLPRGMLYMAYMFVPDMECTAVLRGLTTLQDNTTQPPTAYGGPFNVLNQPSDSGTTHMSIVDGTARLKLVVLWDDMPMLHVTFIANVACILQQAGPEAPDDAVRLLVCSMCIVTTGVYHSNMICLQFNPCLAKSSV